MDNIIGEALILMSCDKYFIMDQKNRVMKRLLSFQYNAKCGLPAETICNKINDLQVKIEAFNALFDCIKHLEDELSGEIKVFYFQYFKRNTPILKLVEVFGRSKNYYYGKKRAIVDKLILIMATAGYTTDKLINLFNEEVAIIDAYERVLNKNKRRILKSG